MQRGERNMIYIRGCSELTNFGCSNVYTVAYIENAMFLRVHELKLIFSLNIIQLCILILYWIEKLLHKLLYK
jgi:hypothetical protein